MNDQVLTLEEFNQQFEKIKPPRDLGRFRPEMGQQIVKHWIETELLFQEASRRGIDQSPDLLEKLEEVKKRMITLMLIQEELDKVGVSDEEIADYFERYQSRFRTPEMVRLRHILVETKEEAEEIQERLNKGEDFEELAREASTDIRTKRRGGDLSFTDRRNCQRRFGSSFANAAFSLEKGEVSQPVRSNRGAYHLIKLEEKRQAGRQTLKEVRERVERGALREKKMKTRQEFIESLRNKAEVEKNLELLGPAVGPPVIEKPLVFPPEPEPGPGLK
ncbi:unnamed protein product [marine sediment metagenome]|uniref:peptidylprolyl isomerase n=1 Tax=marine sediment metagenome TaxID=412755 RepID=X0SN01_9ZZZZ